MRLTADGALAVHHDADVPGLGPICELAVSDLPAHVPLLADALAACGDMVVNVEIKNAPQDPGWDPGEAVALLTVASIDESGWTERVIVSSFQPSTLRAVQAADGRLVLGALWGWTVEPVGAVAEAIAGGLGAVHPFVSSVTPALVTQVHEAGLAMHVWTVNSPDDLRAMVGLGVDAVITDRLVEALDVAR